MIQCKKLRRYALVSVFIATIISSGCKEAPVHKSDQELEQVFNRSRDDFIRLASMAEHDNFEILWIKTREMQPAGSDLPPQRWDEYIKLCDALGIRIIERLPDRVKLTTSTESEAFVHEGRKGYVYSQAALSPVVTSLDNGMPPQYAKGSKNFIYKPLTGSWYLFLEQD